MTRFVPAFISVLLVLAACGGSDDKRTGAIRSLAPAATPGSGGEIRTAVFAGGCFWGVEAVFEHVNGVVDARSGYAGGSAADAQYERVTTGKTGHAEAVEVRFDPGIVTYSQLLAVFFTVAHDPTQLNRQGPDHGPQYRSAIFYSDDEQRAMAAEYIAALNGSGVFSKPVVTEVAPLEEFFAAEPYHEGYLSGHRSHPYIVMHDLPKLEALKAQFPDIYREQ